MIAGMAETSSADRPLPMLRGDLVWLRAAEKRDFVGGASWVTDLDTAHFLGVKAPFGADGAEQFAQKVISQHGREQFSFSICRLDSDTAIGNVTLRNIDRENGNAEVSIVIAEKASQGQGLGTDAMNCLLDFALGELRLERVYLHVFDYNARARRSYEKSGFQSEAILRHARFHRGVHHDVELMSVVRDDWLRLKRRRAWE